MNGKKAITLFLTTILSLLCFGCALQPVAIEGTAMKPTLNDGDRVFVDRNFGELKRGDIVVFLFPQNQKQSFVKRIIGLPGEKLEIKDGKVFINEQSMNEPYLHANYDRAKATIKTVEIPADKYFVMGDNRDNSYDSRAWGTVPKNLIYGKYYTTYLKGSEK